MKCLVWFAAAALIAAGCESDSDLAQRESVSLTETAEWHGPDQESARQFTAIPSVSDNPFALQADAERLSIKGFLQREGSEIFLVTPEGTREPYPESLADRREMLEKILTTDGRMSALWLVWRSGGTTVVLNPHFEIIPGDLGTHRPYSSDFRRDGSEMERDLLHFCRLEPTSPTTVLKVTATLRGDQFFGAYDPATQESEGDGLRYPQLAPDEPGRRGPRMRFSFSAPASTLSFPINARAAIRGSSSPVTAQFWGEPDPGDRNLMRYNCQLSGNPEDVERIEVLQSEIGVWRSPEIAVAVLPNPANPQYNQSSGELKN